MNILEWRKNPERLSLAMDMLSQQTMREMLAVMDTEHPGRKMHGANDGFGATRALGRIEGFQEALEMIHSFAVPLPSPPESIPITWNAVKEQSEQS